MARPRISEDGTRYSQLWIPLVRWHIHSCRSSSERDMFQIHDNDDTVTVFCILTSSRCQHVKTEVGKMWRSGNTCRSASLWSNTKYTKRFLQIPDVSAGYRSVTCVYDVCSAYHMIQMIHMLCIVESLYYIYIYNTNFGLTAFLSMRQTV